MYTGINILIFEENINYRKKLESIIQRQHLSKYPNDTLALSTDSPEAVLQYIKTAPRFTVYLLDTAAAQKKTGLSLAAQIKQFCPKDSIVFMTNRGNYLLTNMKCKLLADAFILKDSPLLEEEITILLRHFTTLFPIRFSLPVKYDYEKIFISFDNIYYIETIPDKIRVNIVCKHQQYEKSGTLLQTEKILDDRFERVSRFCIINTDKITNINRSKHIIKLMDSYEVQYSNVYFKKKFENK